MGGNARVLLCLAAWLLLVEHLLTLCQEAKSRRLPLRMLQWVGVFLSLIYVGTANAENFSAGVRRSWLMQADSSQKLLVVKYIGWGVTSVCGLVSTVSETRAQPRGLTKLGWFLVVFLTLGSVTSLASQYLETVSNAESASAAARKDADARANSLKTANDLVERLQGQSEHVAELRDTLTTAVSMLDRMTEEQRQASRSLQAATDSLKTVKESTLQLPERFLVREEIPLTRPPNPDDWIDTTIEGWKQARRPREALLNAGFDPETTRKLLKQAVIITAGNKLAKWSLRSLDLLNSETAVRAANSLHQPGVFLPRSNLVVVVLELAGTLEVQPDVRSRARLRGLLLRAEFQSLASDVRVDSISAVMPGGQGFGDIYFGACPAQCAAVLNPLMLALPEGAPGL
jgi:hypothetical protein